MEVSYLSDFLNVRTIKMESDVVFDENSVCVESSDPLSVIPQFVTESDLGLMQPGAEILQTPLAVFSDTPDEEDAQSEDSGDEVIIQLMDIRTRLSKLRTILEGRLGGMDLSDYTFWLQDAKMLESHKTLVEQCIRGTGVVQVNIQIKAAEKKINILDVLKPDEDCVQVPPVDDDEIGETMEPLQDTEPSIDPVVECETIINDKKHAAAIKWVVDGQFKNDYARAKVPDDATEWSVQHVKLWIQWAVRQFNLMGVKLSDWNITGRSLVAMTNHEFKMKVPSDPGDLFWTHFELLRKCQFIAVVQTDDLTPKEESFTNVTIKKKKKPVTPTKEMELSNYPASVTRTGNNGQVQLWQFLLELLTTPDYYDVIRWDGPDGEFILLEPETVAKLWGARKQKPRMNYEKLSRALRYYYDGDMIAKVTGKRFVYKFVCDLRQLIGYNAVELHERVKAIRDAEWPS